MSDKFRKNKDDMTDSFYLNETVGPEHYRRYMDEQIRKREAQKQAQQANINPYANQNRNGQQYQQAHRGDIPVSRNANLANRPLFSDEQIPTYTLPEQPEYDYGYDDGYEDDGYYEQPQYQQPYGQQQYPYQQQQYQQPYQQQYQQPYPPTPQYPQYPQQAQYQPPEPDEKPKKKKKRKKHRLLKTLLITPILLIGIAVALIYGFATSIDYTQTDLEENQYIDSDELHRSEDVTNILFLGVDDSSGGTSRSDSMILISIDNKHKKIKLTSFLRDSWVDIPSKDKKAKLNAAFAYGGAQLAVDTLEYNFHIDIDHYVMVDFEMFTQIIDALGGVTVEVTEKEAKFIRNTTRHKDMESGDEVLLDGAKALVYCRIRKLDSDYMRTYRQRKVISALVNQAKEAGFEKLLDAIKKVFPLIETDLEPMEIVMLAFKGGYGVLTYEMQDTRAPIEEHMTPDTINGQWVEVLEMDKVREYLYDYIYTDKIKFEEEESKEE